MSDSAPRCGTCRYWLAVLMGRGWCGAVESHPLVSSHDRCEKWAERKGAADELEFIQDADPGDEA